MSLCVQHCAHHMHSWPIRMTRREGHGMDHDHAALRRTFHGHKTDLPTCGQFGRHDPRVGDASPGPLAKVGVGPGIGYVWGDVANDQEVGRIGPEIRGMEGDQVFSGDGLKAFMRHDLTIGVQGTKTGARPQVGGSNSCGGFRLIELLVHDFLHGIQSLLRQRGTQHGIAHQSHQITAGHRWGNGLESMGRKFQLGIQVCQSLFQLHLGETFGSFGHCGHSHLLQTGTCGLQEWRSVQHHFPMNPGGVLGFHHKQLHAIGQCEGRQGRLLCGIRGLREGRCDGEEGEDGGHPLWGESHVGKLNLQDSRIAVSWRHGIKSSNADRSPARGVVERRRVCALAVIGRSDLAVGPRDKGKGGEVPRVFGPKGLPRGHAVWHQHGVWGFGHDTRE